MFRTLIGQDIILTYRTSPEMQPQHVFVAYNLQPANTYKAESITTHFHKLIFAPLYIFHMIDVIHFPKDFIEISLQYEDVHKVGSKLTKSSLTQPVNQ